MMRVHVEGAGMLGCLLMLALDRQGLDFTWHDREFAYSAWPASTGCIYPTNDPTEQQAYEWWATSDDHDVVASRERADYWFNSKNPPHGWKNAVEYAGVVDLQNPREDRMLRRSGYTYHLNVQQFVTDVRRRYASRRLAASSVVAVDIANSVDHYVVAHGNASATRYLWGWHVKAAVDFPFVGVYRPCVTLRVNRFQTAYAYPCPGTALWYVGSSQVSQHYPKKLETIPHIKRVTDLLASFNVKCKVLSSAVQGWRPVGINNTLAYNHGGHINAYRVPAMGANGVRLGPNVVRSVLDAIMERP